MTEEADRAMQAIDAARRRREQERQDEPEPDPRQPPRWLLYALIAFAVLMALLIVFYAY